MVTPLGNTGLQAMKDRGRMQIGKIADITILDPETVTENATYTAGEHGLPSTGIPYVLVNGEIVVRYSKVNPDVKAGQPIRFPVEPEGRFKPMEVNSWIGENTITPVPMPIIDDTGLHEMLDD